MSAVLANPPAPEQPAPAAPGRVELHLGPSKGMRRELSFARERGGSIRAAVYLLPAKRDGSRAVQVAWVLASSLDDCRLSIEPHYSPCLWVGHAAFDVTFEEAQQIRESFAPLGLRIEER